MGNSEPSRPKAAWGQGVSQGARRRRRKREEAKRQAAQKAKQKQYQGKKEIANVKKKKRATTKKKKQKQPQPQPQPHPPKVDRAAAVTQEHIDSFFGSRAASDAAPIFGVTDGRSQNREPLGELPVPQTSIDWSTPQVSSDIFHQQFFRQTNKNILRDTSSHTRSLLDPVTESATAHASGAHPSSTSPAAGQQALQLYQLERPALTLGDAYKTETMMPFGQISKSASLLPDEPRSEKPSFALPTTGSFGAAPEPIDLSSESPQRPFLQPRKPYHEVTRPQVFGEPALPAPGFDRVCWVRQDPETLANWHPQRCKSLAQLYTEYPDKQLRGIETETLALVGKVFQQIAEEAAHEWLDKSCPGTKWSDNIRVEALYNFDAPQLDWTIVDRAVSLQSMKSMAKSLLFSSRANVRSEREMTPLLLIRLMEKCRGVCQIVRDDKRRVLMEKTKEKLEWLPVGLDCMKLDIQRRAIADLEELHKRSQHSPGNTPRHVQEFYQTKAEIDILDRSLIEFQEHRLEFVIETFKTLKQLLATTA
ncbi:uncharacterized protein JN550_002246 [Neoarthrinium moseri]|uniref:uncharacterized protein n=1 Tax=Neoarthrinium moseri TaxID=1658444 RepID=UPI001FDBDDA6|nr:uncharacterized protein JN550_002246 [Neoarthrinium moseri]KAI1874817.1 hypothetical protein JN550_002246 [Neoarthrinium moseri]